MWGEGHAQVTCTQDLEFGGQLSHEFTAPPGVHLSHCSLTFLGSLHLGGKGGAEISAGDPGLPGKLVDQD